MQGNMFNNALLTHGDPDLYGFYLGHVQKMLAQKKNNDYLADAGYHKSLTTMVTSYLAALRDNDEILIKVENAAISAAYQDNFGTILARAECTAPAAC
ncbi:hypothetical protein [Amycolatopsis sp. NPDC051102]|uniref:hypothetical protein n=1 Tax=Amycolatopsis sp. NPDC051102 TaxID=3155163 RepID=UPI00341B33A1